MKKILLLSALAVAAVSAQAETFGEVFKVQIGHKDEDGVLHVADKVYESGAVIDIPTYEDTMKKLYPDPMWQDFWGTYNCECDMVITNISDEPWQVGYSYVNITPTEQELSVAALDEYGFSICYSFYNPVASGQCMGLKNGQIFVVTKWVDPGSSFLLELHQQNFTNLAPLSFSVTAYLCSGDDVYGDDEFEATFEFSHKQDVTLAVDALGADASTAEYFNLQGVRVANPDNGLFIKKQGGKTSKVIL